MGWLQCKIRASLEGAIRDRSLPDPGERGAYWGWQTGSSAVTLLWIIVLLEERLSALVQWRLVDLRLCWRRSTGDEGEWGVSFDRVLEIRKYQTTV